MSVVFDPHGTVAENVQTKEAQTLPATGPKLIFPTEGAFYSDLEFALFDGSTELQEQVHYYKVLPYATGVLRTGRRVHGAILVIDETVSRNLTVTYHPLGINVATATQQTAFVNGNTVFTDKYWEDVIGEPYFPPVDIQFDWDNWCGEKEVMAALGKLAEGLNYKPPKKDALAVSKAVGHVDPYGAAGVLFNDVTARHQFSNVTPWRFDFGNSSASPLGDYSFEIELFLPKWVTATDANTADFSLALNNSWAVPFLYMQLKYSNNAFRLTLERYNNANDKNSWEVASIPFTRARFAKPFRIKVQRFQSANRLDVYIKDDTGIVGKVNYDHNNPPTNLLNVYTTYNVATALAKKTDLRTNLAWKDTGYLMVVDAPGYTGTVNEDLLGLMRTWYNLIRATFDQAPAHDHIARKDNPHNEEAGWIKALVRNGISADAARVYGRTLPQLTTYVNALAPTAASLASKVRREVTSRTLKGTIVGVEGLTSFTQGSAADDTRILAKFDKLTSWLVARNDNVSITAGQYVDIKAGTGVLRLYNDQRGLQWNGETLLTHETIGPYIPQGGAAAEGFVGVSSASITLTGKGIGSSPFVAKWLPPDASDINTVAMRKVTDEFGTSPSLAATPSLLTKLAANFTGKLLKTKANINGLKLEGSIYLSKDLYGLSAVTNISDVMMPMSDAMELLIADYVTGDHTHPASMFGIGVGSVTRIGTVKLGGLVNDNTVVLNGRDVLPQATRLDEVDTSSQDTMSPAVINILRFNGSGTGIVDGVEIEDFMITLPASTYYAGGSRPVPAVAWNLMELYPNAYENQSFFIYVDALSDGSAAYKLSNTRIPESDTLTEIGTVETESEGILRGVINNVTRLGSFREFEEHTANPNAHVVKVADKNSLGLTAVRNIPAADMQTLPGFVNGFRDWLGIFTPGSWGQSGQTLNALVLDSAITTYSGMVYRQELGDYTMTTSVASDGSAAMGGQMGLVAAYVKRTDATHTLAVLLDASGRYTDSQGRPVYAALVIDPGESTEIVIPSLTWRVGTATLSSLGAITANLARVGNTFTVNLSAPAIDASGATDSFEVDMDKLTVKTGNTRDGYKTVSLEDQFTVKAIPLDFFERPVQVGVMGLYRNKITYGFTTFPQASQTGMYTTLTALLDGVSPLAKVRVVKGTLTSATLTQAQIEAQVPLAAPATFDKRGLPATKQQTTVYSNGTEYTMLIMRPTK